MVSSLADVILVSGAMAGAEPDLSVIASVREAVDPGVPVLLNTGARAETIDRYFKYADGCIVGSSLKVDGYTWNPVDPRAGEAVRGRGPLGVGVTGPVPQNIAHNGNRTW